MMNFYLALTYTTGKTYRDGKQAGPINLDDKFYFIKNELMKQFVSDDICNKQ